MNSPLSVFFISFFLGLNLFNPCSKNLFAQKVFLPVGGSKILKISPFHNVHVSNGKVIQVKDLENKILIYAKKTGQSDVVSGRDQYSIHVLKKKTFLIFNKIQNLLEKLKGLSVETMNHQVVVNGELLRISDWIRLSNLFTPIDGTEKNPPYFFKAKIQSDFKKMIHEFFENKMRDLGRIWSSSYLNLNQDFIELPEEEKKNKEFWSKNFHPFGLSIIFSKHKVKLSPMVRVQIHIAEVNKSWQRQFGFRWPDTLQAQIFPLKFLKKNLNLTLESLENKGEGQILASPNLVCQSGSKASFLAGGELPIKTSSQYSSKVVWKPYGVLLNVRPLAESNGHMSIEISAEVSLLDNAQSVNGIPALKTNRISSHFNLKEQGTIALSGLILHDSGHSSDQTPHLASLPFLGRLFKSKNFKDQKSELVIFVSPQVIQDELSL